MKSAISLSSSVKFQYVCCADPEHVTWTAVVGLAHGAAPFMKASLPATTHDCFPRQAADTAALAFGATQLPGVMAPQKPLDDPYTTWSMDVIVFPAPQSRLKTLEGVFEPLRKPQSAAPLGGSSSATPRRGYGSQGTKRTSLAPS